MGTIKRRLILCGKHTTQPKYQGGQAVNIIGKYLFKHIDGAYNFKKGTNTYDVYFTILYQLKEDYRTDKDHDMHEMNINISITTYSDKLRMNIIEISPREKTLGFNTFSLSKFDDLQAGYELVMNTLLKRLSKEYQNYDFIF